ncbi:MAG: PP2C family protein-serine/threonine phosphatase, partial [Planctomycetota bacterium]
NLDTVLRALFGRVEFTLVSQEKVAAVVRHSTLVTNLSSRLSLPRIEPERLRDLLTPRAGSQEGASPSPALVSIDGEMLPVIATWRLGAVGMHRGYLLFHQLDPEFREDDPEGICAELRHNVSLAFHRLSQQMRGQEQIEHYQAKLHAINEIGELLGSLELDVLLTKLMELSLYIVDGQVGSIVLNDGDEVVSSVEWGLPLDMARCFRDRANRVISERVLETGEAVSIRDFRESEEFHVEGADVNIDSYLCIPLISKNRTLGVINIVNSLDDGGGFTDLDRDILMTISSLASTSLENAILYQEALEKERYRQSMAIARDIQMRLYPRVAPDLPGLDIAWRSASCEETGGDYFDFIPLDDRGLALAIGDVSGHGIGAALLMASARAGLRSILSRDEAVSTTVQRLNDQLEMDMEIDQFMTLFVAAIRPGESRFHFVNAGHDAPCIYRGRAGSMEVLGSTGIPLGLFAGAQHNTGEAASLAPGDILFLTTDGLWEVYGPGGQMLGKERLIEIFRESARGSAREIADAVLERVAAFTGGGDARDDVTLVVACAR